MNSLTLFKNSFYHFQSLKSAKKTAFWKVILYIFFLSFILSLPLIKQGVSILNGLKQEGTKIAEKLPDFSITDGKMETKENTQGFIYQTNSVIFTFDPEGKRSTSDIAADTIGNTMGFALLKDKLLLSFPTAGADIATAVFGSDQFEIPYSNGTLDGLNNKKIKETFSDSTLPIWVKAVLFLLILYPTFINLVINLFLIVIGANLYSKMKAYPYRLFDCLKIVTYCMTLPVFLSSAIRFINPSFNDNTLIVFISLVIFFFAVRDENTPKKTII